LASKKLDKIIGDFIELGFEKNAKYYYKNKIGQEIFKQRHVDFNQGTDARLINKFNIKLLSKISINPLRIAFDNISFKEKYINSILLAANHGIQNLSNYILYNFHDSPEDFWQRLKINIDLNKKYGLKIYSFPMKYIPLNAKDRSFIAEPKWNWFFIRNVQRILNVLKGTVMTNEDFFYRAFGESEEEFLRILYMPEKILMYRGNKPKPEEKKWLKKFQKLSKSDKQELIRILCENRSNHKLRSAKDQIKSSRLSSILEYYYANEPMDDDYPLFN
jgi:hypothetical protein